MSDYGDTFQCSSARAKGLPIYLYLEDIIKWAGKGFGIHVAY